MKKLILSLILILFLSGCSLFKTNLKISLNKGIDTVEVGSKWLDKGARASENKKELECIVLSNNVDTSKLGVYEVVYQATAFDGTTKTITRKVSVIDSTKPHISLNLGVDTVLLGNEWIDSGATAIDNYDGDISRNIIVSGTVDTLVVGEYIITYKIVDSSGNEATIKRFINIVE